MFSSIFSLGTLFASCLLHDSTQKSFPPFELLSPTENAITWDIDMSPYAGGEDLLFAHRILEKLETYYLGKSSIIYSEKKGAKFIRLSELVAVWLPINYFTAVVQHEVFGHGYRIRDLDEKNIAFVTGYSFGIPPPYGGGGGATFYRTTNRLTLMEESALSSAGVEASALLAWSMKIHWLQSKKIDPRQAALYLLGEQDLTLYVGDLKDSSDETDLDGHDIHNYITSLNYTYPNDLLKRSTLYALRWINLADPFTFYAIYSWFHYVATGKETDLKMIASSYLPGFRLGLTPFGPEVFFEQFVLYKQHPVYGYIKGGYHAHNFFAGLGIYMPSIWRKNGWTIGLRSDIWRQPKILTQQGSLPIKEIDFDEPPSPEDPIYTTSQTHQTRYGTACSLIISYAKLNPVRYNWEIGYKTRGFLPGYSLFSFPTVRLSVVASF